MMCSETHSILLLTSPKKNNQDLNLTQSSLVHCADTVLVIESLFALVKML